MQETVVVIKHCFAQIFYYALFASGYSMEEWGVGAAGGGFGGRWAAR